MANPKKRAAEKKARERARAQKRKLAEAYKAKRKTGGAALSKKHRKQGYDPDYATSADVKEKQRMEKVHKKYGRKLDSQQLAAGTPGAYKDPKERSRRKTREYQIYKTPVEKRKVHEIEEKTAPERIHEERFKSTATEVPPTRYVAGRGHAEPGGQPTKPGTTLFWKDTKGKVTADKPTEKVYKPGEVVSGGETSKVIKPGETTTRIQRDPATAREQFAKGQREKREGMSDYSPDKYTVKKEKERKGLGVSKERTKTKYFGAIPESEIERQKELEVSKREAGQTGGFKVRGQKIISKYKPSKAAIAKAKQRKTSGRKMRKSARRQ